MAVAGIPGDSTTFYFGSVNGGIWKTIDAGVVWTPIFDGQPVGSVGALAVAPSDPKVIYAGTGESDIREDLSSGNGVYKSTDAGSTWTHIGLGDTRQISRIVIDPQNPNIVYVGALGHVYAPNDARGVFKSVDGGAHWTRVLDLGPEIGVADLAMAASAPQLLFAGAWQVHRVPWSAYAPIDGPGSGLYRSRDGGATWSRLSGNGLPDGDWGRIGVDVSPNGKRVYALIVTRMRGATDFDEKKSGLYRSDDGGDSWTLANADPRLTSRAWYFNRVTIDPQNPDVLYVPNVALYRSEDGGKTISIVRGAPGGDDYHQLWVDPKNSASMVLGTDQGTAISLTRGRTWSTWYNQPTAQFYHLTIDNRFPYTVYGTQQDSGAAAVLSRTDHDTITARDWFLAGDSESGYMVIDPKDPDIIYLSGTYGPVSRFNRRTGFSQNITPWPVSGFDQDLNRRKYRDPWTPPLALSPVDAAMYLGTQYVMKTVDGGLHWETISPDLTGAADESQKTDRKNPDEKKTDEKNTDKEKTDEKKTNQKQPASTPTLDAAERAGYGVVYAIAPSPLNRDLIWAGSDTGLIHVTRDGGKNWTNITPRGVSAWNKISMIEASHFDAAVAYAAVDRGRLDDQTPYLYRTRDYGATWQLITNGISAPAFLRSIREDPQGRGLLFAGTEFGVYVSFNDGDHWQSLQLNLPMSSVRDLSIHGDDLVAATFGRAFWILDNITPLRQVSEATKNGAPWLYRPGTAVRVDNDSFQGTPLPPEEPQANNPPSGAMIDYFLSAPAGSVMLEIFDAQQNLVRKFSSDDISSDISSKDKIAKYPPLPIASRWFPKPEPLEKTAGMHRFVWDLAWRSSGGPSIDDESETRNPRGPKIIPGTYQVRLTVDGRAQERSLIVIMDPRSSATPDSLAEQFRIGQQIFGEAIEARRVLSEIESIQNRLTELQQKLADKKTASPNASLSSDLAEVQAGIEKILTKQESSPGSPSGLQDAYAALAAALRAVETGDRALPSQVIAVYTESSRQLKLGIAEWERFRQLRMAQLNKELRHSNLDPIPIPQN